MHSAPLRESEVIASIRKKRRYRRSKSRDMIPAAPKAFSWLRRKKKSKHHRNESSVVTVLNLLVAQGFYDNQMPEKDNEYGTYFYPLIEAQCYNGGELKKNDVYVYYENLYGKLEDTNKDGVMDSYYYDLPTKDKIRVTATLVTAMVTKGDSLRNIFNKPFFKEHEGNPSLSHVPYPHVMVKEAEYFKDRNSLEFTLLSALPNGSKNIDIICRNIAGIKSITLNGETFNNYNIDNGELTISISIKDIAKIIVVLDNGLI